MDADRLVWLAWSGSKEEELSAGVCRDGLDRVDKDALPEVVLVPVESLIGRVQHMVRRVLVAADKRERISTSDVVARRCIAPREDEWTDFAMTRMDP